MGVGKKGATFSRDLAWSVLTTLMLAILSSYLPPIGMTFPPIRIVPLNNDVHRFLPSRLFPFSSSLSLSPLTLLLSASLPPFSLLLSLSHRLSTLALSFTRSITAPSPQPLFRSVSSLLPSPSLPSQDLSSSVCCDCWPVSQGAPGGCADHLCCPPASFCLENGLTLDHCCGLQGTDCCGCFNGKR